MKYEDYILIKQSQRKVLKDAYLLIKSVKDEINYEYEEYAAIDTSLEYLNNAINYKAKFLS